MLHSLMQTTTTTMMMGWIRRGLKVCKGKGAKRLFLLFFSLVFFIDFTASLIISFSIRGVNLLRREYKRERKSVCMYVFNSEGSCRINKIE